MQKVTRNSLLGAAIVFVLLAVCLWLSEASAIWVYMGAINLTTWLFYGYDKRQAVRKRGRIPEVVLHLLTLIGGTVGALVGQLMFHHKTKKSSFQAVFIGTIVLQAALIGVWFYWRSRGQ